MKKFWLIILVSCALKISAQTTIVASDDFENSSIFTITNGAYMNGTSGAGDRPASSAYSAVNSYGYTCTNTTVTLTTANLNTSALTSISCSLRVAAFSIASTGNGMDAGDFVRIEISPDGGANYYSTLQLNGFSNAYWHYTTGTGTGSTAYDGDATAVTVAPTVGGAQTTGGYSTLVVSNLPAVTNLIVRITLLNNSTNERWAIDDFKLWGTASACAPPAEPTSPSSNSSATNVGCNSMILNWTIGNGARRLVVLRAGAVPSAPGDNTSYTADNTYGSGTSVGGGFAVYEGTGNSVFVNGLSASTTYYWAVYESNGSGSCVNYLTTVSASGNITTTACSLPLGITAIYIDACPATCNYEGNNEIIFGETGSYGVEVNTNGPIMQYDGSSPPTTTKISTYTANATNLSALNTAASCGTTVFENPYTNGYIPANSKFMIANNCMCTPSAYDFSGLCGQTVYTIFGTNAAWPCNTGGGIFGNASGCTGTDLRYIEFDFNSWGYTTVPIYSYDICDLTNSGNGDYVLFDPAGGAGVVYGNNACAVPLTVLPVVLSEFTTKKLDKAIELNWKTASEENVKTITVERSEDGYSFKPLVFIQPANSESGSDYSFIDNSAVVGMNYYRIQFTDHNGRTMFSPIRAEKLSSTGTTYFSHGILYFENEFKKQSAFLVSDLSGRIIVQGIISAGQKSYDLRLHNLTDGVYLIQTWTEGGQLNVQKIMIGE